MQGASFNIGNAAAGGKAFVKIAGFEWADEEFDEPGGFERVGGVGVFGPGGTVVEDLAGGPCAGVLDGAGGLEGGDAGGFGEGFVDGIEAEFAAGGLGHGGSHEAEWRLTTGMVVSKLQEAGELRSE
jgi:hypothetical protein